MRVEHLNLKKAPAIRTMGGTMNHLTTKARTENRYFQKLLNFARPEGPRCPHCGQQDGFRACRRHKESWVPDYRCLRCHHVFNAWTGTELKGTHHPPSEILRIMRGIVDEESDSQLARELGRDRGTLAIFRHKLQRWMNKLPRETFTKFPTILKRRF
jgi:transposase-like protein